MRDENAAVSLKVSDSKCSVRRLTINEDPLSTVSPFVKFVRFFQEVQVLLLPKPHPSSINTAYKEFLRSSEIEFNRSRNRNFMPKPKGILHISRIY